MSLDSRIYPILISCIALAIHVMGGRCDAAPFDAVRGFVAVEPYELRLSALVRPSAYQSAWRMKKQTIGRAEKEEILSNITTLFSSGVNVATNGSTYEFSSSSVRFIKADPERGYVSDDREEIPLYEALVGISMSAIAVGVSELEIEWLLFPPGQDRVAIEITGGDQPAARFATKQQQKVSWKTDNPPQAEGLMVTPVVEKLRAGVNQRFLYGGLGLLGLAALVIIGMKSQTPGWIGWIVVLGIAACVLAFRMGGTSIKLPNDKVAQELTYRLLKNTYHAFDFRDESQIYDVLQKSISGPLLEQVYLEFMRSLELETQGGPRVRVQGVAIRKCEMDSAKPKEGSFRVNTEWITVGEVTHWGHTHTRNNLYEGIIEIASYGNRWKVSGIKLTNEERLMQQVRRSVAGAAGTTTPEEPAPAEQPAEAVANPQ